MSLTHGRIHTAVALAVALAIGAAPADAAEGYLAEIQVLEVEPGRPLLVELESVHGLPKATAATGTDLSQLPNVKAYVEGFKGTDEELQAAVGSKVEIRGDCAVIARTPRMPKPGLRVEARVGGRGPWWKATLGFENRAGWSGLRAGWSVFKQLVNDVCAR